jgi:hypothetical protein
MFEACQPGDQILQPFFFPTRADQCAQWIEDPITEVPEAGLSSRESRYLQPIRGYNYAS